MTQEQLDQLTPNILMKSKEDIINFLDNNLVIYNYKVYKNLLEFPHDKGRSIIIPYGLKDDKRREFLHYLVTNLDITHVLENNLSTPHQINNSNKENYFLELISFKNNHKKIAEKFEDSFLQLNSLQCSHFSNCQICPYALVNEFQNCLNFKMTASFKDFFSNNLQNLKTSLFFTQDTREGFYFISQSSPSIKGFITNSIEKKFIISNEDIYNFSKSMFKAFNNHGYLFNKKGISDFYYDGVNKNFFLLDYDKVFRITNNLERIKDITVKPTNILKGSLPYYNKGRQLDDFQILINIFTYNTNNLLNLLRGPGGNNE